MCSILWLLKKTKVKSPIVKDTKPTGQDFLDRRNKKIAEAQRKAGEARKAAEEARRQEIEETNRRRAAEDAARFNTVTPQGSESGGDSGSFGDPTGGIDTSVGTDQGGFGSGLSTATGGLIPKKKVKRKKMKRGGLASR